MNIDIICQKIAHKEVSSLWDIFQISMRMTLAHKVSPKNENSWYDFERKSRRIRNILVYQKGTRLSSSLHSDPEIRTNHLRWCVSITPFRSARVVDRKAGHSQSSQPVRGGEGRDPPSEPSVSNTCNTRGDTTINLTTFRNALPPTRPTPIS